MKAAPQFDSTTGEITLQLGGQPRTLAFNMGTLIQFSSLYKGGLQEALGSFADNEVLALSRLSYFALRARKHLNDLPAYFDEDIATEWIGALLLQDPEGLTALTAALAKSLEQVGNKKGAPVQKVA
jgi:hypothetical protein